MLTATPLVAIVLVASLAPCEGRLPDPPPLVVSVVVTADVSPRLISTLLDEAHDIWRAAGVPIVWRRGLSTRTLLRVTVGDSVGTANDSVVPLGWTLFDDDRSPEPELYVSYRNAAKLLDIAGSTTFGRGMPPLQRDTLLGRAMGRALAHELGHYLLASKAHSAHGLMRAQLSTAALFRVDRGAVRVDATERRLAAARLQALKVGEAAATHS